MAKIFYLSEIYKFAVAREQDSEHLYKLLAEQSTDAEAKKLFQILVKEEIKHEELYANLLAASEAHEGVKIKEDDEYIGYMRELIDISRRVAMLNAAQLTNTEVALKYAVEREKDSILFYVGLKNYVASADQIKIEQVIREEAKHIVMLTNLKHKLLG